jgi:hypothetical protein
MVNKTPEYLGQWSKVESSSGGNWRPAHLEPASLDFGRIIISTKTDLNIFYILLKTKKICDVSGGLAELTLLLLFWKRRILVD